MYTSRDRVAVSKMIASEKIEVVNNPIVRPVRLPNPSRTHRHGSQQIRKQANKTDVSDASRTVMRKSETEAGEKKDAVSGSNERADRLD